VINRLSRILMLSVATLWLLAPLHFAAEEHRWCQEHAGFEHGDFSEILTAPSSTGGGAAFQTGVPGGGGDHHHCPVVSLLERSKTLQPVLAAILADRTPDHPAVVLPEFMVPQATGLYVAPKTSPPAFA
jgi:hypothetical protein